MNSEDLDRAAETYAAATDFTVGVEEEFSILDPRTLEHRAALTSSCATAAGRATRCCASTSPAS